MSPKLRKWVLVGGGVLVGLILVCLITYIVLGASGSGSMRLASVMATEAPAAQPGYYADKGAAPRQALTNGGNAAAAPPMPEGYGVGGGPATDGLQAAPTAAPAAAEAATTASGQDQQAANRLIIRNGSITIAVENTSATEKSIEGIVTQMAGDGAFVVSTNESPTGYDQSPYINMVIRVPAAHFDEVMDNVAKMAAKGTTPTLTKTAEDVTAQYVDVTARLSALEAARDRLQTIMSQSQNTTDLLQAEQQLTQREADINALKGQKQYLEQSAALSAITISLQPYVLSQPVDTSWRPLETVREAFNALLNNLQGLGDFAIRFVIGVLPILLIIGLIIYGIFLFVRGQVRRSRARNAGSGTGEA